MEGTRGKRKMDQDVALDLSSQSSTGSSTSSTASSSSSISSYSESRKQPYAQFNRMVLGKSTPEYKVKRDRNNEAVKKSREKSKVRLSTTLDYIGRLSEDNKKLVRDVDILSKEVKLIRSMYTSHLRQAHNITLGDEEFILKADQVTNEAHT